MKGPLRDASLTSDSPETSEGNPMSAGRYDAFISYSHAADGRLAPALQSGIERFASPWWRRRSLRVFRDETGLSANPHLWSSIVAALDASEWLILLASPESAASDWVGREISHWVATSPVERILVVVTDGSLVWDNGSGGFDPASSSAVHPALREVFADEPRFIDMTWLAHGDQVDRRDGRFQDALAEIAAPLHGVAKDEIAGEDVRQHRRTIRIARLGTAALATLAVAALAAGVIAFRQRNEAQRQEQTAVAAAEREQAGRLSAQAGNLADGRIDTALLIAVEASLRFPGPATDDVLLQAIADAGPLVSVGLLPVQDPFAYFEVRGSLVMTEGDELIRLVPGDPNFQRLVPRPGKAILSADAAGYIDRLIVSYTDGLVQILESSSGAVIAERQFPGPVFVARAGDALFGNGFDRGFFNLLSPEDLTDIGPIEVETKESVVWAARAVGFVAGFDGSLQAIDHNGGGLSIMLDALPSFIEIDRVTSDTYIGLEDGTVVKWDYLSDNDPVEIAVFDTESAVSALAVSSDGSQLAVARNDGALVIIDLTTGKKETIAQIGEPIVALLYGSSFQDLTAASASRWFRFDVNSGSALAKPVWSPSDPQLFPDAAEWADGQIYIAGPPGLIEVIDSDGEPHQFANVGENAVVPAITVSDGAVIASVVELPGLPLTFVKALQNEANVDTPTGVNADIVTSIADSSVVALHADGLESWRTATTRPVVSLLTTEDGNVLMLDTSGTLTMLDASDGSVLQTESNVVPAPGLRLVRSGDVVVVTGGAGRGGTRIIHLSVGGFEAGSELGAIRAADADDHSVVVTRGGSIGLADPASLDFLGASAGTGGLEGDAEIVPGGNLIALHDATTLWFVREGTVIARFGVSEPIMSLVGGGPNQLVTMNKSGVVHRWDLDRDHLRRQACAIVARDLTEQEWSEFFPAEPLRSTCNTTN